jgi:hypothetical protein
MILLSHDFMRSWGLLVSTETNYGLEDRGSSPNRIKFLYLRLASYSVGTGDSFPGCKTTRGVKLTIHLHLEPRLRNVKLYLHSPIRPHDVMFN